MHRFTIMALAAIAVAGCNSEPRTGPPSDRGGRYIGIGIYAAGELWQRIADAPSSDNPQAATLRDDDHVIVVVDSHTGEIRQCGNLSGHCLRMNPWSGQAASANLTAHAEDVERQVDPPAEPNAGAAADSNATR